MTAGLNSAMWLAELFQMSDLPVLFLKRKHSFLNEFLSQISEAIYRRFGFVPYVSRALKLI